MPDTVLFKESKDRVDLARIAYYMYRLATQSKRSIEASSLSILGHGHSFIPSGGPLRRTFSPETADRSRIVGHGIDTHQAWPLRVPTNGIAILSIAFSPDGQCLAAASADHTVRMWDTATGALLRVFRGHADPVNFVVFSADGGCLASASSDQSVRTWDVVTGACLHEFKGHAKRVTSVAFSPDSLRLASASDDRTVSLWDAATGARLRKLKGHKNSVLSVAFSPDGRHLASASSDHRVRIWDASTGALLHKLKGHKDSVTSVAFSPDGHHIVSASLDHSLGTWRVETGLLVRRLKKAHAGPVTSITFSSDGRYVASGSLDRTARVWDAVTGKPLRIFAGHTASVTSIAFSAFPLGGHYLASCSHDGTVRVRDVRGTNEHSSLIRCVTFSLDGRRLASVALRDHMVHVWDAATGALLQTVEHLQSVMSVRFLPDGHHLVSADGIDVRLWGVVTGKLICKLSGDLDRSVALSPDGHYLAYASPGLSHAVHIRDITQQTTDKLRGHSGRVRSVAFSPDGHHLASASDDSTVRTWDVQTRTPLQELKEPTDRIHSVTLSADRIHTVIYSPIGGHLASAFSYGTVCIWDVSEGVLLHNLVQILHDRRVLICDVITGDFVLENPKTTHHTPPHDPNRASFIPGPILALHCDEKITYLHFPSLEEVIQPTSLNLLLSDAALSPPPVYLDQTSLCIKQGDNTLRLFWLPHYFKPTTPVTQHRNHVCIGGEEGMIAFVNLDKLVMPDS